MYAVICFFIELLCLFSFFASFYRFLLLSAFWRGLILDEVEAPAEAIVLEDPLCNLWRSRSKALK
jgi:hypothetical protein